MQRTQRSLSKQGFNPRAPGGARLPLQGIVPARWLVSIHAPRAERDSVVPQLLLVCCCFNPRAPGGARLRDLEMIAYILKVSIHAPRAERDFTIRISPANLPGFNPRAPGGARPLIFQLWRFNGWFQSTRPGRSATLLFCQIINKRNVSIHAPRAERDF